MLSCFQSVLHSHKHCWCRIRHIIFLTLLVVFHYLDQLVLKDFIKTSQSLLLITIENDTHMGDVCWLIVHHRFFTVVFDISDLFF